MRALLRPQRDPTTLPSVTAETESRAYRLTIWGIALGIFIFGAGVVAVAWSVGNRQLLKDGFDWIYDVAFYGLAALAFGRGAAAERWTAMGLAGVMAFAGAATLSDLGDKIVNPRPIDAWFLGFSAGSAVILAFIVAGVLFRFRRTANPLIKATWLSSRNDILATTGYALAGFAARVAPVRWPEFALDLVAAALAFQAAWAIWRTARAAANPSTETLIESRS